jgi:hypothetical protein
MINTNEEGITFETKPTFITTEMHGKPPPARLPIAEGSTYAVLNVTSRHSRWQRRPAAAVTSLVLTCIQNVEFQNVELKWSARKSNKIVFLLSFPKFLDLILASTILLGCIPY